MASATDWGELTTRCGEAMEAAKENPGRYGGRYVGRRWVDGKTVFVVTDDDDPELYRDDEDLDILAHVEPTKVNPMGSARYWLHADGTVHFED